MERARDAMRGVMVRVKALLEAEVESMGPDDVEVLALQLKLANVNLNVAARELREVEKERRFIARELEREALLFEPDSEKSGKEAA